MTRYYVTAVVVVDVDTRTVAETERPQEAVDAVERAIAAAAEVAAVTGLGGVVGLDYAGEPIVEVYVDLGGEPKPVNVSMWRSPQGPVTETVDVDDEEPDDGVPEVV